ncbi:MAG: ISAs1 family transposase [Senegalia sp. (in: firmicutes)]
MARKAKKLQELQELFDESEIDFSLLENDKVINELIEKAESIYDIRNESYIKDKLSDIVILTLFAILANANEWKEIEAFGKSKEKWLRKFLELPNGTPSDDTIRVVISNINSNYFYSIIVDFFMEIINGLTEIVTQKDNPVEQDILSIDGKTSCGSKRKDTDVEGSRALHTLNAYSSNYGMCIGQVFVNEKSNEIPAVKDLLKILDIKGTVLTWDALNTQKSTVEEVIRCKGDYVGALKGNQVLLYNDVKDYFEEEVLEELQKNKTNYKKTHEKEHSAIVTREYFLTTDINWMYDKKSWKGLKSIGIEKKTIKRNNGTIVKEERYFICSIDDINMFSRAVRDHWGVENGLHWHLDFTFKDDKNTTMSKTGAKNLQIIKKIVLTILKTVQTFYNISLKMIRYRLSLDFENEISNLFKLLDVDGLKVVLSK